MEGNDEPLSYWDPGASSDSQHRDAVRNRVAPQTAEFHVDDGGGSKRRIILNWKIYQYSNIIAQSGKSSIHPSEKL